MPGGRASGVNTVVSTPDDIFQRAERPARRKPCSRSDVYGAAHDEVTGAMNRVCDEAGAESDPFLSAAGRRILGGVGVEWQSAGYLGSNVVPSFFATGAFSRTT